MNTLDLDAWCKESPNDHAKPWGEIHFRINDQTHLAMERAEEQLQDEQIPEVLIPIEMADMELNTPEGGLDDCQMRVYLNARTGRGHFHLVGHRPSDHALVYSNAVMVDQLG